MPKHRTISGRQCVAVLCNKFGFVIARQKGSHVVLKKKDRGNEVGTVVPLHPELKKGTLKGILKLAKINEEDFFKRV